MSRQAVSKWELGQSQPDLESLKMIKEKFNLSYDSLISDEKVLESSNHFIELQRRKSSTLFWVLYYCLFRYPFYFFMWGFD